MKSCMRLNSRKLPVFNGLFTLRNGNLRWFSLMCKQCFVNSKLLVIVLKNQNNSNNKILPSLMSLQNSVCRNVLRHWGFVKRLHRTAWDQRVCETSVLCLFLPGPRQLPLSLPVPLQTLAQMTILPHHKCLKFHYFGSRWASIMFTLLDTQYSLNSEDSSFLGSRNTHWSKSDREGKRSYDIPYIQNLKINDTNELIYDIETDSQT